MVKIAPPQQRKTNNVSKREKHYENEWDEISICETKKRNDVSMKWVLEVLKVLQDSVKHIEPIRTQLKAVNNKLEKRCNQPE